MYSDAATRERDEQVIHGPEAARLLIRSGNIEGPTSGLAPGYLQANLVVLPKEYADDFAEYCHRNPKACPLIGQSRPGIKAIGEVAKNLDVTTDVPTYLVYENGVQTAMPNEISDFWTDESVAFVLASAFVVDQVLINDGIELDYVKYNRTAAMYRTSIDTVPVGPFSGKLVVSMRPLRPTETVRATQISSRFSKVYGAPAHIGVPELLGISDISKPDFGDPPDIDSSYQLPVFWASGVTPQLAIENAKIPLVITHKPGCMLITDIRNSSIADS